MREVMTSLRHQPAKAYYDAYHAGGIRLFGAADYMPAIARPAAALDDGVKPCGET